MIFRKDLLFENIGAHCAREFLRLGAVFSVGLRELSSPKAQERYARIPADRIFPETDGHPEDMPRTAALLAIVKGPFDAGISD